MIATHAINVSCHRLAEINTTKTYVEKSENVHEHGLYIISLFAMKAAS